jgi:GTP-binding protein HflX
MKKLFGNTAGLKANQIRRLENLYRRRVPPEFLITSELARDLGLLSHEIRRQLGLLINRQGRIAFVIVGDTKKILIPATGDYHAAPGRLNGLRCVHTHLNAEPLNRDDLTDLSLLRLDLMAAIGLTDSGHPLVVHAAHVLPKPSARLAYRLLPPLATANLDMDCLGLIEALEDELERVITGHSAGSGRERALLVSVSAASRRQSAESMAELRELARSGGIEVVDTFIQHRDKVDHRFLIGTGKLQELAITALQEGATLIVFDQELNPSQIRSVTDQIELKVIDRTQLILDIFAQRALSREGKLQVELAQLKYMLPRLVGRNTALSRLAGGIGGRGPGETKLEIDRRRVRERIKRLEAALEEVRQHRRQRRAKRDKKGLPVISIIGYTNAGKSTLLNSLTRSQVLAESRLFATLDPSSRRLKFPRDIEVIITDTVGFIKDLPRELMVAFRATLEELEGADLLLHVVDASNPRHEDQITSVERIIAELNLEHKAYLKVLNKSDLLAEETVGHLSRRHGAVAVSALAPPTLLPLIERMQALVEASQREPRGQAAKGAPPAPETDPPAPE